MPYIGKTPTATDTVTQTRFICSAAQVTFAVTYDVGAISVYLNGILLDPGGADYTATDGSSVVLTSGAALNDLLIVESRIGYLPSDVVSASAGGTFASAVTMTSPLAVASGGSGVATHTANGALLGAGTGAVTSAAPGSSGNVLTSNGTVWASAAAPGGGKIGQVLQTHKSDRTSIALSATNSFTAMTGISQAITPAATNSKILVLVYFTWHLVPTANGSMHFGLFRDSTQVGMGVDSGGTSRCPDTISYRAVGGSNSTLGLGWYSYGIKSDAFQFLDSPSTTSSVTYALKMSIGATYTGTVIINGSDTTTGNAGSTDYQPVSSSAITCMEVLA